MKKNKFFLISILQMAFLVLFSGIASATTNPFDLSAAIPIDNIKAGLFAAAALFIAPIAIKWGIKKVSALFGS